MCDFILKTYDKQDKRIKGPKVESKEYDLTTNLKTEFYTKSQVDRFPYVLQISDNVFLQLQLLIVPVAPEEGVEKPERCDPTQLDHSDTDYLK